MQQHGDSVPPGAKGAILCPFCKKKSASLQEVRGQQYFKCFRPACVSRTSGDKAALDEVGYLAFKLGLSRNDAFVAYLKAAGVWKERCLTSILPGQKKCREPLPKETDFVAGAKGVPVAEKQEGDTTDGTDRANETSEEEPPGEIGLELESLPPSSGGTTRSADGEVRTDESDTVRDAGGSGGETPPPGDLSGGQEDGGDGKPKDKKNRGLLALREFYSKLTLTSEDEGLIWRKRGLPKEACDAFGFKSSLQSNKDLLVTLTLKYSEDVLVAYGLFERKDGKCLPAPQLYGMGNAGRKNEHGEVIWNWVRPILIPYFDRDGEVIAIRPHRGGVAGQPSRLFVARFRKDCKLPIAGSRNFKPLRCIVTEGEFKACALYWVFDGQAGVAALPGISQSKNYLVLEDLKEWLRTDCSPERLVVAFDNEEKGDPKLPGFKPDKRKRFDAEIWARYLAIILDKSICETRVCRLPNEWRDAKGKADWDGAMARMVASVRGDSDAAWAAAKVHVREQFSNALGAAVGTRELKQTTFFSADDERIIQFGLDRLFYTPRLPNGGERELALARKLVKLANTKLKDVPGLGMMKLAEQYRETVGWYYTMKPLSDAVQAKWIKMQQKENERPYEERDWNLIWFCELRLKGIPTLVANFRMDCFFDLVRADGKRDLIVEIITNEGERSGRLRLDAEAFSTPSGRTGFRTWLRNHSKGCWKAGERELQALQLDAMHQVAHTDVYEVTALGSDEASRLWFMGDCAYGPEGELLPDQDGVYWKNDGTGYLVALTGSGGQEFRQGLPLMHPMEVLQEAADEQDFCLVPAKEAKQPEEPVANRLFVEVALRLNEALGGHDGFLVLGAILAFLGGSEFFKQERCFPGLFIHGETGHGKSTLMGWLMEVIGFHSAPGIGASRNSTVVGMQQVLEQYSNLPAWLTDFSMVEMSDEKMQIMHDAYNRVRSAKWSADGTTRKVRTMFVIDGESRPHKTSTRFRYVQVLVSKATRQGNQVPWFETNRRFFFALVRSLLRRREEFSGLMMKNFSELGRELADVDRRQVQVHGAAYGAFMAAAQMFGGILPKANMEEFRQFLKMKCVTASSEGAQAVNVNQFWVDLISAVQRGVFGKTKLELQRFFKVEADEKAHAPGAPGQPGWKSYTLFIEINGVLDLMQKDFKQRGKTMALGKTDFQEQMSHRPYWSDKNLGKGKRKFDCKQRFAGANLRCWAIEVDKLEVFGYRQVSDEELMESKRAQASGLPGTTEWPAPAEWSDPRKGDLYSLIEELEKKPGEGE
jgi:hypothetical protein